MVFTQFYNYITTLFNSRSREDEDDYPEFFKQLSDFKFAETLLDLEEFRKNRMDESGVNVLNGEIEKMHLERLKKASIYNDELKNRYEEILKKQ
jgi:hypothetical protein